MILEITDEYQDLRTKAAAFADELTAAGDIKGIKYWWDQLCKLGPKFGYFPEATKYLLIVKKDVEKKAEEIYYGSDVKITTEGKRHLGAALGTHEYKEEYLATKVDGWIEEIKILSEIAKSQPQAAYSYFITGFRHKVTYYMRTIHGASNQLQHLDQAIQTEFIPSITGGIICNENDRKLLSLPPKLGGLGIPIFAEISQIEYENSATLTEGLCSKIIQQTRQYENDGKIQSIKLEIRSARLKETTKNCKIFDHKCSTNKSG